MRTCSILGGVLLISLPPMFLVLFVIGTGILRVIQICVVVALAAVIRHLDIVVGTHGRTDFDRYVFGSVTEYLVWMSPIPVLTVRAECRLTST